MPGMPFHLEKGHALMALEDLLNDASHHAVVARVFDGLRDGTALGEVFADALADAPTLDHYFGHAGTDGLGAFVRGSWFGQATAGGPTPYWLDYEGDVDGIVREALLFAMERAWSVDRGQPLPATIADRRGIELVWHCAQRWFDAWITWQSAEGPVTVLFATPPHTGGDIIDRIADATAVGRATPVSATTAGADGDMVLVCQEENGPASWGSSLVTGWWASGAFPLPPIGRATRGTGAVGAYSISADAGGNRPRTMWG